MGWTAPWACSRACLQGDTLINLDWETEGSFDIGSAGGDYGNVDTSYAEVETPAATAAYTVTVSGLQGGHSGVDINMGRGHATKLLVRLLSPAAAQYGVRLAQIAGGTAANAIPTSATALVVVPERSDRCVPEIRPAVRRGSSKASWRRWNPI